MLVLPNGVFLQQPLDWDRQLSQEAFDDRPTLGEFILDLDLQDVGGKRHEAEPLETAKISKCVGNREQHKDSRGGHVHEGAQETLLPLLQPQESPQQPEKFQIIWALLISPDDSGLLRNVPTSLTLYYNICKCVICKYLAAGLSDDEPDGECNDIADQQGAPQLLNTV